MKNLNQLLELLLFDTQTSLFLIRKEMKRDADSVSYRKQVKELYILHKIFLNPSFLEIHAGILLFVINYLFLNKRFCDSKE